MLSSSPFLKSSTFVIRLKILALRMTLFVLVAILCASAVVTVASAARLYAPVITATKTDTLNDLDADNKADPGETIDYTVVIPNAGAVEGTDDALALTFSDTIDPNTTLGAVSASPVGVNDTFPVTVLGNVSIDSAALASPFSVTGNDYLGLNPVATITQVELATTIVSNTITTTTDNGGDVVMTVSGANMGKFTYDPPAGFEGTDTFTYTLADNATATSAAANRTATVSIPVSGMIWFINNNASACIVAGCGRLSNPFSTLAAFNTLNDGTGNHPASNDDIFIYESATGYSGAVTLQTGQKLIGQDATASLSTITGLTPPTGSPAFPAMNSGNGTVTNLISTVTLNTNVTARGFSSNATTTTGMTDPAGAITGVSVSEVNVTTTTGTGINFSNTVGSFNFTGLTTGGGAGATLTGTNTGSTFTFTNVVVSSGSSTGFNATGGGTLTITGASNTLTSSSGTALNVTNTTIGGGGLNFLSISANGGSKGIVLNSTGTAGGDGGLSVTGTGTTDGSGGTIQNTSTRGGEFITTKNLSLKNMNFTNANSSADGGSAGACDDLTLTNCNSALYLSGVTTAATLDNLNITGTMEENGITAINVANFKLDNSLLDGCGDEPNESCVEAQNLSGTSTVNNTEIRFSETDALAVVNTDVSLNLTISGSTFRDPQTVSSGGATNTNGEGGFQFRSFSSAAGAPTTTINILNSSFLRLRTQGIQVFSGDDTTINLDITGSTINAQADIGTGIDINADDTSTLNFNITDNPTIQSFGGAAVNITSFLNGHIEGRVNDNDDIEVLSGAGIPVRLVAQETSTMVVEIDGNTVSNVNGTEDTAIDVQSRFQTARVDATITGNIVTVEPTGIAAINLISGSSTAGESNITCGDVANNAAQTGAVAARAFRIRISDVSNTNRMYLEGFTEAGTALQDTEATWNGRSNTPTSSVGSEVAASLTGSAVGPLAPPGGLCNSVDIPSDFALLPGSSQVVAQAPSTDLASAATAKLSSKQAALGKSATALLLSSKDGPAAQLVSFARPAPAQSGETVSVGPLTLPATKSIKIVFRVTVDALDSGEIRTRILNQGNVTYTGNLGGVVTIDPTPSANAACVAAPSIGTQTCTPVDRPDTTVSSINRQTPSGASTNATSVTWRVTFATAIAGLTNANFTLDDPGGNPPTGESITSVTAVGGSPATQWDVLVNTGSGDGTLGLDFANDAGLSHDVPAFTTGQDYIIDKTPPTVTINQAVGQADPTNSNPINFTVVFNEAVTDFDDAADVTLSGTAGATTSLITGGPTTYNVAVSGMTTDGTVIATVGASVATDLAGNNNASSTSTDNTVTYDTTSPTVTINQAGGQNDPTNANPINFTVVFNEAVTDFDDLTDVTLSGTASASVSSITGGPTTYTVAVNATTDGTVIATVGAGVAQDAATNTNAASTSTDNTVTRDTIAPTVTINQAGTQADPTGTNPIEFTVVFSEAVTDFDDLSDVTLTGTATATVTNISGSGTTYTVQATATSDGTVIASVPVSKAQDAAGNNNAASTSTDNTVTYDGTQPAVTINQAGTQADPTASNPIEFTVVFSEAVTDFDDLSDVTLTGTATATVTSITGGPTTYTVQVTATSDGTVTASVPAGVATDGINTNAASTSTDNTVLYDTVPPEVTINQAGTQADPTNSSSINFTVVFSEAVTDFNDATDVTLGGTAGATTVVITGGPTNYNVAVSGMTSDGTVTASIPEDVAQDLTGKDNNASTSTDNTVTYDGTVPTVTINQAGTQADPTGTNPIEFTVVFSEAVVDFDDLSDVTLTGTATATVTNISGGPTTYTIQATATSDGTVIATVPVNKAQDAAGNNNAASTSTDNTVTYDGSQPTVTINQAGTQTDPTSTNPIEFTVVFSEAVTDFDDLSDVTLTGTATATVTNISGSGTTYTVQATATSDGTVIASVPAGVATDGVNTNAASTSTDNTVTRDTTGPTVTINQAVGQADPTNLNPIEFTVVFSEAVTGFDVAADVTLSGTATATVTGISGSGATYTVQATATTDGTVIASIPASVATDPAGNSNAASTSTDNTVTRDTIAPTVTINQKTSAPAQADPTGSSPIHFTVVFSEAVTDFDDAADVTLSGTAGATSVVITGGPSTYNVAVSGMTGGGTVIATINASVATDLAGNANGASTSTDNTVTFTVNTTTTITSDNPDPSIVGQAVTVNFTVVASVGANPSVGSVTVDDGPGGAAPCVGAVTAGAGTCNITFTSAGAKTLTATYPATGSFNGSNDTESHSVSITIVVNTFNDDLTNNGNCSLREAVRAANTNAAVDACPAGSASIVDIITLPVPGTYNLTRVGSDDTALLGDLDITGNTRIVGALSTIISGLNIPAPGDRVFQVLSGATVEFENLTIKKGKAPIGAGIHNAGTLTLNTVSVTENAAITGASGISHGAGIYNTGTLTLNNSTVSLNAATSGFNGISRGGGIHNNGGTLTLNSSTVTGNSAISGINGTSQGGGIYTGGGSTTLNSTTPSGNIVVAGAGGTAQGPNTYP